MNTAAQLHHLSLAVSLPLALIGCTPSGTGIAASPQPEPSESPASDSYTDEVDVATPTGQSAAPIDPRFEASLRLAASRYRDWGRVDERPDLAPWDCRAPTWYPSHARLSKADDAQHGHKLYYLFAGLDDASARDNYSSLGTPSATQAELPVGFTIVKQSWAAEPIKGRPPAPAGVGSPSNEAPPPITVVKHEGQWLEVGAQAELFVMAKLGPPDMPGTDAGWVYGTLTADGQTVTSAGLVRNCMDCHEAATHERLFGLQKTKAVVRVDSPWLDTRPNTLGLK